MHGWSKGIVVIQEKSRHGLLFKVRYKGYLQSARNLTGYSLNDSFENVYHHGDRVLARYRMFTAESGPQKGEECIEFMILENEEEKL